MGAAPAVRGASRHLVARLVDPRLLQRRLVELGLGGGEGRLGVESDHASLTFSFAALARAFASRSALFTSAFFARSSLFSSFTCGTEVGGCEYDADGWCGPKV